MRIQALLITLLGFIASCHAAVCRFPGSFNGAGFSDWGIAAYSAKHCGSQINRIEGTKSLACTTLSKQAVSYQLFADRKCSITVYNGKGCRGWSRRVFRRPTA
jgi:hypothetical protein